MLDPDLAAPFLGAVIQKATGGFLLFLKILFELRDQTPELLLLIEPEADLGPLFMLKALQKLIEKSLENHL